MTITKNHRVLTLLERTAEQFLNSQIDAFLEKYDEYKKNAMK